MAIDFNVRLANQIRDAILSSMRSRYSSLGLTIDTTPDSDAYNWADSIALQLEGIEARAWQLTQEIFPDTSTEEYLLKHGDLIGLSLKTATPAKLFCVITGTPGSGWGPGNLLAATNGVQYRPTPDTTYPTGSGTLPGSGTTTITVLAQTSGDDTNRIQGEILTWVTTPTGLDPTATVTSVPLTVSDLPVIGSDDETLTEFAQRILRWWLERPGSGNRADFVDWAESRSGIASAFCYPLYHPVLGPGTLGSTTLVVLGPVSQRNVTWPTGLTNLVSTVDADSYIRGTGIYANDGGKIPAFMDPTDFQLEPPVHSYQDVDIQVVLGTGYSFPFVGTFAKASSPSSTTTRVYLTTAPATISVGALVAIDSSNASNTHGFVRGAYEVRSVSAKNDSSAPYWIEVGIALGGIPGDGNLVRPAPSNWVAAANAVIAVFDGLGPGDVNIFTFPSSQRWPRVDQAFPDILYKASLVAAVVGVPGIEGTSAVPGVVSATVVTPSADVLPSPKSIMVPNKIWFRA